PGNRLTQPLHDDVADAKYADTGRLQRVPRAFAVGEQEMGRAIAAGDPGATTFDADAGPRQRFAHVRQGTGPVVQLDRNILHRWPQSCAVSCASQRTSQRTELAMKQDA